MEKTRSNRLVGFALAALALLGFFYLCMVVFDPWRLPPRDWSLFKKRFISPQGRVVDNGNGDVTHSEGQGYALLLAEAYGDRPTFDRVWKWTKENLQTRKDDKLLSWLWKPGQDGGSVADANNASDAEILVAWALVRASKRWGNYAYQQAAAEILVDLRRIAVRNTSQGPVLLPGADGFVKGDGIVLNPSYAIFPAFGTFAKSFPGSGWDAVSKAGLKVVGEARFGQWSLVPDWVLLAGETFSMPDSAPPDFGYNAVRVPLHLAWGNPKSPLLKPCANFWKMFPDLSKIPATVNLETNAFGTDPALPGVQAIARFVLACESGTRLTVRDIPPVMPDEPYFSASLKMLTKLAVRESLGGKR